MVYSAVVTLGGSRLGMAVVCVSCAWSERKRNGCAQHGEKMVGEDAVRLGIKQWQCMWLVRLRQGMDSEAALLGKERDGSGEKFQLGVEK